MRHRMRIGAAVGGPRGIVALGALYIILAVVRAFVVVSAGARVPGQLLNLALITLPSLGLVYGGYLLPRTTVHPDVYPRVTGWSILGGGVMIGVVVLVAFTPGGGIEHLRLAILLFGALGSVGGLAIGLNEAHAITRAHDIEQKHEELEQYSQQLQRQNERLESFAGMLAHELRNPLNIAQIYVQQVDDNQEETEQIDRALERIEEMIDILLVTARGTDADIDREPVSLAAVAEDVWDDLSPEAATLVVESNQTIRGDPVHVRHLFKNLFSNAIEHGRKDVTIRVGDLEDGGFYVEDDGPGVPEEDRDAIFDAGYTTRTDGTGLGLTFVAQLAEAYDWDCTVTESADGGARFECRGVGSVTSEETRVS